MSKGNILRTLFNQLPKYFCTIPDIELSYPKYIYPSLANAKGSSSVFDCLQPLAMASSYDDDQCMPNIFDISTGELRTLLKTKFVIYDEHETQIPLSAINSISACRDGVSQFSSLLEMGKYYYEYHEKYSGIQEKDPLVYATKYLHQAIEIGRNQVNTFSWKPDVTWINNGGGHRFSSVYYINHLHNLNLSFKAKLRYYHFNQCYLENLLDRSNAKAYIFYLHSDPHELNAKLRSLNTDNRYIRFFDIQKSDVSGIQRLEQLKEPKKPLLRLLFINANIKNPLRVRKWLNEIINNEQASHLSDWLYNLNLDQFKIT